MPETRGASYLRHDVTRPSERLLHLALLIALPFVVYSNNYRHAYHLDDAYTIVTNPSVRSLRSVPSYFADPSTYTSMREQAEYRPLLQVTYALNYAMGGYDTWWWHFTQIVLHTLVALGLYALGKRILTLIGDPQPHRIAFAAAAIFAVHPAASGVVNYLNARSSLLTAAFLLPALLAYMKSAQPTDYSRPQWTAAVFYALALFTKVEAVGVLGAFWAFDLWQRSREAADVSLFRAIRTSFDLRTLRRLAPALVVSAVYFVIRWRVMAPFPLAEARHAADVGAYEYFATQLTAWWYYCLRWVAPVRLVADYLSYPVFRSVWDPVVMLAAAGWIAVAALLVGAWKRAPYLMFIAVAALALLSPTSSIAPLAEMVNEHRPYLPMGILSFAVVIPLGIRLREWPWSAARAALVGSLGLALLALSTLTYRRNEVFSTDSRFWQDILSKAPSSRAHLNFGLALMRANDMQGAMREFQRSLEIAPYWHFTHINLGVAYGHLGQVDSANSHFDRAVEYDRYSGLALTWRGEFRLTREDFAGARDDFLATMPISLERYRNTKGLATAFAGLGDVQQALLHTEHMLALDSTTAAIDIATVAAPFFRDAALRGAGIGYFRALESRLPGRPWIAESLARLSGTAAPNLSNDATQQQLMREGLALLRAGQSSNAAASFRRVLAINPSHYGAHYQLAVALDALGKAAEARALWERVLRMATEYQDAATATTARARLARRP